MKIPFVTAIVTAMTDGERPFVRAAVDSALSQSTPCACIVVVTDSNDWVEQELFGLSVTILRTPICPPGRARNLGVRRSQNEYVAFLDGDDFWHPDKIRQQVELAKSTNTPFVGTDHVLVDEFGVCFAYGLAQYIPMPSSWLVEKRMMLEHPFNEELFVGEDGEWWQRTKALPKTRLPSALLNYRVRLGSLSSATVSKRRKMILRKISRTAATRTVLLMVTNLVHSIFKSHKYKWHSDWG